MKLAVGITLAAGAILVAGGAAAQGFKPTRNIDFIVHTGPGGGGDTHARAINAIFEKEKLLPVRANVVNKPGGGGAVATAYMAEKKGDTHTIGLYTALWLTRPLSSKEIRVQFHELTPLARLALDPAIIVVKDDAPYKTIMDFIEAAKKAPGQLKQAGGSIESRDNLNRLLLQKATGASWVYVPFPGGGERVANVLGGHAQLYIADAPEVKEHVRKGSLRVIVQLTEKRLPQFPNVPTIKEAGIDLTIIQSIRGIVAPPEIPKEAVDYWVGLLKRMTQTASWKRYIEDNQLEEGFQTGAELMKSSQEFIDQRREIYKQAGIKVYR
jgi:putative tricarboxylic transport membrane protein